MNCQSLMELKEIKQVEDKRLLLRRCVFFKILLTEGNSLHEIYFCFLKCNQAQKIVILIRQTIKTV